MSSGIESDPSTPYPLRNFLLGQFGNPELADYILELTTPLPSQSRLTGVDESIALSRQQSTNAQTADASYLLRMERPECHNPRSRTSLWRTTARARFTNAERTFTRAGVVLGHQ
ncbi:hypothetical protein M8818_007407 [Zalaria obscura]|uniref:Uncharacterized protein n=1 Tax=Zalaria obscura TaxID=2024903 RepID=A0ACC3S361_9PEZI